jgi:Tfp pilus assembly protein PilF
MECGGGLRASLLALARVVVTVPLAAGLLQGCASLESPWSRTPSGSAHDVPSEGAIATLLKTGLEQLRKGNTQNAFLAFNAALKLDPRNASAHLINAIGYHLEALRGDATRFDLAEAGYHLALQFDRTNPLAALQLGRLYLDTRRYPEAQEQLALALLLYGRDPESARVSYELAAASYFAQDLKTAYLAIRRAEQLAAPDKHVIRASALIHAAVGEIAQAEAYRDRYAKSGGDPGDVGRLSLAIERWKGVLEDAKRLGAGSTASAPTVTAQAAPAQAAPGAPAGFDTGFPWPGPPITLPLDGSRPAIGAPLPALRPPANMTALPRMAVIDAIVIRTTESATYQRGVNLLDGLQLQFGPVTDTRRTVYPFGTVDPGGLPRVFTRTITIPMVTYSLNIANVLGDKADVIARPSLISLDQQPSVFFSGSDVTVALAPQLGGVGSLQEKPIGVSLSVTPTFVSDDTVFLVVQAARVFVEPALNPGAAPGTFGQALRTARNSVNANVVMKLGQTLILSGLHERETTQSKSGVPFLQDIPVLQYLFSEASTGEFSSSVLVLLTPREARLSQEPAGGSPPPRTSAPAHVANLHAALKQLHGIDAHPNMLIVLKHLEYSSSHFVSHRAGDFLQLKWTDKSRLEKLLYELLQFIYY